MYDRETRTELLTDEHILTDIRYRARHHYSAEDDRISNIIFAVSGVVTVIVGLISKSALALLCMLLPLLYITVEGIVDAQKAKKRTVADFSVTTDKLSSVAEEYVRTGADDHHHCYICYFEGGAQWEVSSVNYTWSKLYKMTRKGVYNTSLQGDTFYIVWDNQTGEPVLAYNTRLFRYQKSSNEKG